MQNTASIVVILVIPKCGIIIEGLARTTLLLVAGVSFSAEAEERHDFRCSLSFLLAN
jgi:hypothetical protein